MKAIVRQLAVSVLFTLTACGGSTPRTPSRTNVAAVSAGDLNVELLTDSRLEVGMTPVYVKLTTAGGALVTDATSVKVTPLMSMTGGTAHSAPVIAGAGVVDGAYYASQVVFSMPSGSMGSWSAKVTVQRAGMTDVEATFPDLAVADTGRAKSFTAADTKYLASLNFEAAPRVGLNPVTLTLHRMQDMMTFVPVDDAAFALDPEMPSMGHGSPGSVAPVLSSSGKYQGQLSFSMTGDWQITVTITRGGAALGTVTFATTF